MADSRVFIINRFPWSASPDTLMCVKGVIFPRRSIARIVLVEYHVINGIGTFNGLKIVLNYPSTEIDVADETDVRDALRQMGLRVEDAP